MGGWKSDRMKKILISFFFLFGWEWKSKRIEKVNLYKFTYIPLLKSYAQLKKKASNQIY